MPTLRNLTEEPMVCGFEYPLTSGCLLPKRTTELWLTEMAFLHLTSKLQALELVLWEF